jgi:hypothetical protein
MNIFGFLAKILPRPAGSKHEGKRIVIVHNHLFKNAGSTIDWALKGNFGRAFVDHREDDLMRQGAAYLGPYLLKNQNIKALSTHHLTLPLPELDGVRLIMIMMLRHPIERVTSAYKFERAQESDTHPGVIHARKYSLRDYIRWRMRPDVGSTIRNFQTRRMLPPRKAGQEIITEAEMADVAKRLKALPLVGLVDRFDESMVLFEEYLRPIYPQIDLSYVAQNVGQEVAEMKENRLERLRSEVGDDTYELLLQNNQRDMQLLELAQDEFNTRVTAMEDFARKLAEFRARCTARQLASA